MNILHPIGISLKLGIILGYFTLHTSSLPFIECFLGSASGNYPPLFLLPTPAGGFPVPQMQVQVGRTASAPETLRSVTQLRGHRVPAELTTWVCCRSSCLGLRAASV